MLHVVFPGNFLVLVTEELTQTCVLRGADFLTLKGCVWLTCGGDTLSLVRK